MPSHLNEASQSSGKVVHNSRVTRIDSRYTRIDLPKMASHIWNSTKATVLLFLPLALICFVLVRYNRLRHIPGPLWPSLTDFWLQSKIWRGSNFADIIPELHKKYGPVVRWGPNRVSFASAAAIPAIYSTKDVFPKVSGQIILDHDLDRCRLTQLLLRRPPMLPCWSSPRVKRFPR